MPFLCCFIYHLLTHSRQIHARHPQVPPQADLNSSVEKLPHRIGPKLQSICTKRGIKASCMCDMLPDQLPTMYLLRFLTEVVFYSPLRKFFGVQLNNIPDLMSNRFMLLYLF